MGSCNKTQVLGTSQYRRGSRPPQISRWFSRQAPFLAYKNAALMIASFDYVKFLEFYCWYGL